MAEKLTPAQQRAYDWIQGHNAAELGALGQQIGTMLAEVIADGMDARREAEHWKKSFETTLAEFKGAVAAVIVKRNVGKRLVVTKAHYDKALGKQLMASQMDGGNTRVYELVDAPPPKPSKSDDTSRIIRPN